MKTQNYKLLYQNKFLGEGRAFNVNEACKFIQLESINVDSVVFIPGTGLYDVNDREIFDGDILKAYKANSYLDGFYCVCWDNERGKWNYFKMDHCAGGKYYNTGYQVGSRGNLVCEILENVYESPELEFFSF